MDASDVAGAAGRPPPSNRLFRREVFAWAMYDWANSVYSTLLITVVVHYIQHVVLPGETGKVAFPLAIAIIMFISAVLSPIIGAMADANRSKRRWLTGTVITGSLAAAAMSVAPAEWPWAVMACFLVMGACFELSLVPYNGFLTEISNAETVNRVSAYGFAMGYVGGSIPLVAVWAIVRYGHAIGLADPALQDRLGILLLGVWWLVFSVPVLWRLRDRGSAPERLESFPRAAWSAGGEVVRTLRHLRSYPVLATFLLAFLLYNDGIQTVITQSTALADDVWHFSLDEMCLLVLMIQLIALPGSLLVGWLSDRFGQKPVLLATLAVWASLLVVVGFIGESKEAFCALGVVLALVLGGTQSVSRAMMGVLTPAERAGEFFGFFNFSGKAASVLGPVQFSVVIHLTGNMRLAALSLLVFFLIGGLLLATLRVPSRK